MTKAMFIILITFLIGVFAKMTGHYDQEPLVNFQWLFWGAFGFGVFNLIQAIWIMQTTKKPKD